jgi:hypothetical protein
MIKDRVTAGSNVNIWTDFVDERSNPQALDAPPGFSIRDSKKALILSGIAEQASQAQRWQSNVTIPDNAMPGDYTLIWSGTSGKSKLIQTDSFKIVDEIPNYYELDLLLPEKSVVRDALVFDRDQHIDQYDVKIQTPDGEVIYQDTVSDLRCQVSGDRKSVLFSTDLPLESLTAGNGAFALYIISYSFELDCAPQMEHHFLYVVSPKILAYVRALKRMIDKAAIQHPNPALRYNNVDLVAHLNDGLQFINSQPPSMTSYTLADVPDNLYSYLLDAAAVEALSARYLAEAEAAFSFNGQPVTLEVDRTGFIDTARQFYQSRLENLPVIKKVIIMSGGGGGVGSVGLNGQGYLGLSRGPNTYIYLDPQSNSRLATYGNMLSNLGYAAPFGVEYL